MASPQATIRVPEPLAEWLTDRADRSMEARRSLGFRIQVELGMWRATLAACLARQEWTPSEIGLIADVMNGLVRPDAVAGSLGLVAQEVISATHAAPGSYGAKWEIDEGAVVDRLVGLDPCTDAALLDAMSRWWTTDSEHTPEGWASVGVRVR